jgi:hypothetical protein
MQGRIRLPKDEWEVRRRERIEREAERMREQNLYTGKGCSSIRRAIALREARRPLMGKTAA